jgi:hypothetical protein
MPTVWPRLPVEPLVTAATAGWSGTTFECPHRGTVAKTPAEGRISEAARRLGVPARSIFRWVKEGGIPINTLDELCIRIGEHPYVVYGEAWNEAWDLHTLQLSPAVRRKKGLVDDAHLETGRSALHVAA